MGEQQYFGSLLNENELVGSPLCMCLTNFINIVHTVEKTFANIVNYVGKSVPALDISLDVTGEVVVPKAKGRGFYEFVFSSIEDVQRVRVVLSWSLKPGFLKLFAWTPDFNPNNHKQTTVQCWVRFLDFLQEYWSPNIIFAIASCLGTPMCLNAATGKYPLVYLGFW
ncbi:unnamed protein product [Vicia faba]|uniref:DUF4283 domain-containing protein n=1 Tax=Vicia faba TaxID=3906 RepID=A0AAV1B7F8_VICFA|nr:unnamed protein product [Vicia faba]